MKKNCLLLLLFFLAAFLLPAQAADPDWTEIRKKQAWYTAADGTIVSGNLSTSIKAWLKSEGKTDASAKLTVYLCKDKTLKIKDIKRGDVSRFRFKVDKTALPKAKKKEVTVSEKEPGSANPGISAGNENKKITAYIWLEDPPVEDSMDTPGNEAGTLETADSTDTEADETPLTDGSDSSGPYSPVHPSGGSFSVGGGGGRATPHSKEQYQTEIGYDQVGIWTLAQESSASMSTLVISGEEQHLSLTRNGLSSDFVPVLIGWQDAPVPSGSIVPYNTLLLRALNAKDSASFQWTFSGDLLRKLLRSGISYLAFDAGSQIIMLPTEGFLGGIRYDEMKMSGIAGSFFVFNIVMENGKQPTIAVSVGEETLMVSEDPEAAMHWTMVHFLSDSDLNLSDLSAQGHG